MPLSVSGLSEQSGCANGSVGSAMRSAQAVMPGAALPLRADRKMRISDRLWSALQTCLQGVDGATLAMVTKERDHAQPSFLDELQASLSVGNDGAQPMTANLSPPGPCGELSCRTACHAGAERRRKGARRNADHARRSSRHPSMKTSAGVSSSALMRWMKTAASQPSTTRWSKLEERFIILRGMNWLPSHTGR